MDYPGCVPLSGKPVAMTCGQNIGGAHINMGGKHIRIGGAHINIQSHRAESQNVMRVIRPWQPCLPVSESSQPDHKFNIYYTSKATLSIYYREDTHPSLDMFSSPITCKRKKISKINYNEKLTLNENLECFL